MANLFLELFEFFRIQGRGSFRKLNLEFHYEQFKEELKGSLIGLRAKPVLAERVVKIGPAVGII